MTDFKYTLWVVIIFCPSFIKEWAYDQFQSIDFSMFAVSSGCKNDSQLCFKCLQCLDSQILVLLQWCVSIFVIVHAKNDFLCSCFSQLHLILILYDHLVCQFDLNSQNMH